VARFTVRRGCLRGAPAAISWSLYTYRHTCEHIHFFYTQEKSSWIPLLPGERERVMPDSYRLKPLRVSFTAVSRGSHGYATDILPRLPHHNPSLLPGGRTPVRLPAPSNGVLSRWEIFPLHTGAPLAAVPERCLFLCRGGGKGEGPPRSAIRRLSQPRNLPLTPTYPPSLQ